MSLKVRKGAVVCPDCGGPLSPYPGGFQCHSRFCDFLAGNEYDIKAWSKGYDSLNLDPSTVMVLKACRKLMDLVHQARNRPMNSDLANAHAAYKRRRKVCDRFVKYNVVFMNKEELVAACDCFRDLNLEDTYRMPKLEEKEYVPVAVGMTAPSRPGTFLIFHGKDTISWSWDMSCGSIVGPISWDPTDQREIFLACDDQSASQILDADPDACVVLIQPGVEARIPPRPHTVVASNMESIVIASRILSVMPEAKFAICTRGRVGKERISLAHAVALRILDMYQKTGELNFAELNHLRITSDVVSLCRELPDVELAQVAQRAMTLEAVTEDEIGHVTTYRITKFKIRPKRWVKNGLEVEVVVDGQRRTELLDDNTIRYNLFMGWLKARNLEYTSRTELDKLMAWILAEARVMLDSK